MVDLDTMINKISNSEEMKSVKKYAKKTKTKMIDLGINLKGKINDFKDSITGKKEQDFIRLD